MVTSLSGLRFFPPGPAPASSSTSSTDRKTVALRNQETSALGIRLAGLRSALEEIQRIGLEAAGTAKAASAASGSNLGLDSAKAAQAITSVAELSGISTGSFSVNGVSLSVDITTDSLDDVISRINASSAGVTASLDATYNVLTVQSDSLTSSLTLSDDTSSFFTGTSITTGTHKPTSADDNLKEESKLDRLFVEVGRAIDEVFAPSYQALSDTLLEAVQGELEDAITNAFGIVLSTTTSVNALRSALGVDVDFTDPRKGVFQFDAGQLRRAFKTDLTTLQSFLFRDSRGLVAGLIDALDGLGATPLEELDPEGSTGFLVALHA